MASENVPDRRIALVTGAGPQNGRAIAMALAATGAAIVVSDVRPEPAEETVEQIRAGGGHAIAVPFDVTDLKSVEAGVRRIEAQLGPVDILVNAAGAPLSSAKIGLFKDSDPAAWHEWVDLNLYGAMNCIRIALPGMVQRGWGRIVQISTTSAYIPPLDRGGDPLGVAVYGASKAGIESLIRHVAIESARSGVTANAVALPVVMRGRANVGGIEKDVADPRGLAAHIPMRRPLESNDVATTVAWLCSDAAAFTTGQVIHTSGGAVLGR